MAEVRQIPADEYESMKKSYGLSDEQMRSVIGVEPILTKWAEGYGIARPKENEEDKIKERHNQIVAEIKNKLAKESVAAQTPENLSPSIEEKVEQPDYGAQIADLRAQVEALKKQKGGSFNELI